VYFEPEESPNIYQWFFIGSAALALIGCIVSATAQSVGALIGGTTLIGLAASGQQSFAFITGELVPMKVNIQHLGWSIALND
jgi:hypothetical protein